MLVHRKLIKLDIEYDGTPDPLLRVVLVPYIEVFVKGSPVLRSILRPKGASSRCNCYFYFDHGGRGLEVDKLLENRRISAQIGLSQ